MAIIVQFPPMSTFLYTLVLAVVINIVTALFSRKSGVHLLPWLCFYLAIYGTYIGLTTDSAWGIEMKMAQKYHFTSYVIVMVTAAVLAGLYWRAVNIAVEKIDKVTTSSPATPPVPEPAKPTIPTPNPLPELSALFENDWPDSTGYFNIESLTHVAPNGRYNIQIPWRINGDFSARSKFLAFFFEFKTPPQGVKDACTYIADNLRRYVTFPDDLIDIYGKWPDDTSVTHFKDLVFSHRIFIYYENPEFSLEQKASIESVYRAKGLSVQFRGIEYALLHRDDHPSFRPKPLVPNSVLLPQAHAGLSIGFTNLKEGQKIVVPIGPEKK